MKKFLTLLCTAALILSVAGCNNDTPAATGDDTNAAETTTAAAETTTADLGEKCDPWLCECGEVPDTEKCPACGATSPDAQKAAAAEKESLLFGGAEIPAFDRDHRCHSPVHHSGKARLA